jgi:ribosomal protein S18 acetylase RimI-like enzyme
MTIEVRPAVPADARSIAEVHVRAWQETYAHLVPEDALARLSVEQRERRWGEILSDGGSLNWVATEGTRVVGFAGSGAARDHDSPRPLELQSIYVLASHHGSGAGQRLLDAAVGTAAAYLWVADDNSRARAFYLRNGFHPDGAEDMHSLVGTPVLAIRMVR